MTEIDKHIKLLLDKKDWQNPNSFEELGYVFLGPMVFNFFIWLKSELGSCDKILFNSREGYFFKEIYELFKNKYNLPESVYFKTSRKLAALASFETKDDIYNTFKLHRYFGTLSNLLKDRFGLVLNNIKDEVIDTSIEIPNLDEYIDSILLEAKNTRN
jgi:predicted HAD superfamily hydrolase